MRFSNKISTLMLLSALLLPLGAWAADIVGSYNAHGSNPGGGGQYQGTATISRAGDVYKIRWSVGGTYTGTGILTGDVFSVAYTDSKHKWYGVVSYQVLDGGNKLQGLWGDINGTTLGTELLIKQR